MRIDKLSARLRIYENIDVKVQDAKAEIHAKVDDTLGSIKK